MPKLPHHPSSRGLGPGDPGAPGPGPHGPHGPRHHRWIFAHHDKEMVPADYAAVLRGMAEALESGNCIEMNGTPITLGSSLDFELIHEQTPHGTLAIVIRAEWAEGPITPGQSDTLSISPFRNRS